MKPATRLLRWYDGVRRELPWRRTRDPYRVWISEVMLQQTRVETVLPYYRRFLERFPDLEALAAAEPDEVLARWSGLGYYRRARDLHRTARQLVADGGRWPRRAAELRRLPGIGPYTAAAVASIAFGEAVPVVDGNVVRVAARLLAWDGDPGSAAGRRRLAEAAASLLDRERPGDSNQALMELGATLCAPRAPRCAECPLERGCAGRAEGAPEAYPRPRRRRKPVRIRRLGVVVRSGGRVLLYRRPEGGRLLAGLWELPWIERTAEGGAAAALAAKYGGRWTLGQPLGRLRHGITHRDLEVEVRCGRLAQEPAGADGREADWFERSSLGELPMSALTRKALRLGS